MPIKHPFTSAKPDSADSTLVRPSNWNAAHTITGVTAKNVPMVSGGDLVDSPVQVDAAGATEVFSEFNLHGTQAPDTVFRSMFNVLKTMVGATESQQANQTIIDGTVNTTGGTRNVWAGEFGADASRSAGANALTNVALLLHARNGQTNNAIESIAGDWRQTDPTATINNAGAVLTNSLAIQPAGSTVDLTNASAVTLGDKLVAPIKVPGTTSQNPQLGLGTASASANEQLAIKNTVTGSFGTVNGVGIGLDTTVDAGARGGLIVHRGAGGNFGGTDAKALWVSGSNDLTTTQAAGDLVVFNQEAGKQILFVTGGTGAGNTPLLLGAGNKVGFYGTAPVAQQTGVAVTVAAVHAALVALGLITA